MKKISIVFRIAMLLCILTATLGTFMQTAAQTSKDTVYVVPVKQTIESGLGQFLHRAFTDAEEAGAAYIILDINTLGGRLDAALDIGELLVESKVPTVAFVRGNAISAGSYIALNANQIMMQPSSAIGAAAVVNIGTGARVDPEFEVVSMWVSKMIAAAEMNHRNPDYARGMVMESAVVEVPEIGKTFAAGELITFSSEEAVKAGYAEAIQSSIDGVLQHINMADAQVVHFELSFAEQAARFLTNPYVTVLLFIIGLAGIGIEVFAPGFGVPGLIGIAAFALYFFGRYVAGFAEIEHILLFVAGIVLLLVEIFVPSFGILGILGLISLLGGIVLAAQNAANTLLSFLFALVVAIVFLIFVSRYFKKKGIWNKFVLQDQLTSDQGYNSVSDKKDLLGKKGIAMTPLRPAGVALIDDKRIDVVSSGDFIEKSAEIIVQEVDGGRVVVRKI